jgi:hypothetical protein
MRYAIKIGKGWRTAFRLFGFSPETSYVELEDGAVRFRFGTADERVPLGDIEAVSRRRWPFYFGLGPKLGPAGGVAYVGDTDGVVEVRLKRPRRMNVWGPFRRGDARAVTVSLEDSDAFVADLRRAMGANTER